MKTGIMFDLDGTLWDSAKQVVDSWNEALKECEDIDRIVTLEDMHRLMGKVMEDIALDLFDNVPKARAMEVLKLCCRYENKYLEEHGARLYPELKKVLAALKEKYSLYIVSNCQEGYIEAFLKAHKLSGYFEDTENAGRTGKPKGDNIQLVAERNKLERAVYIGDTNGDYEASKAAGIPFVYAAYGFGSVDTQTLQINSISELPALLNGIL